MSWEEPVLEYGHRIPPPRSKPDLRRKRRPSPWFTFLNKVPVGTASFLVDWPKLINIRNIAQRMGIEIAYEDTKQRGASGMRQARVWRRT